MHTFILFHGLSHSGKTTCCNMLNEKFRIPHVTPVDRYKEFLEEVYALPAKSLNKKEFKQLLIPGTEWTWEDLLIKSFHFHRSLDPGFGAKLLANEIICYLAVAENSDKNSVTRNLYISIDSIRNPEEIEALKFLKQYFSIEINLIDISSPFERRFESDCYFDQNKKLLSEFYDNKFILKNDTTINELELKLLTIFDEIIGDK